jgi:hypothetical protein
MICVDWWVCDVFMHSLWQKHNISPFARPIWQFRQGRPLFINTVRLWVEFGVDGKMLVLMWGDFFGITGADGCRESQSDGWIGDWLMPLGVGRRLQEFGETFWKQSWGNVWFSIKELTGCVGFWSVALAFDRSRLKLESNKRYLFAHILTLLAWGLSGAPLISMETDVVEI